MKTTIPPAVPIADLPEPDETTKAAVADAYRRVAGRRTRARRVYEFGERALYSNAERAAVQGNQAQFLDAFGTCSNEFAQLQCRQLAMICRENGILSQDDMNGLLAMVDGMRPDNEAEAALAVQITASHAFSMRMLRKAGEMERLDFMERYMNAAAKLQRTMVAQIEALAKLRRGGEQSVIVKHVHVHDGAQAIVGNVHAGGSRRGINGINGKAHAPVVSDTEVWRENEVGEALPIASGLG